MIYRQISKILLALDHEINHDIALKLLRFLPRFLLPKSLHNPIKLMGIEFKNPVGLSCKFEQSDKYLSALSKLGFGHIELGPISPKAKQKENKTGLNKSDYMCGSTKGISDVISKLSSFKKTCVIGINICKNSNTICEKEVYDLILCMRALYLFADYFVIDIEAPQDRGIYNDEQIKKIREQLKRLKLEQEHLTKTLKKYVPLAVKLNLDVQENSLLAICHELVENEIDAVIVTTGSKNLQDSKLDHTSARNFTNGLTVLESIHNLFLKLPNNIPIIASDNILEPLDARDRLYFGAKMVQINFALINHGPSIINKMIRAMMKID